MLLICRRYWDSILQSTINDQDYIKRTRVTGVERPSTISLAVKMQVIEHQTVEMSNKNANYRIWRKGIKVVDCASEGFVV